MPETARNAAAFIGSKEEGEEIDIKFRMKVEQKGESLGLQEGENTATPKKLKYNTYAWSMWSNCYQSAFLHLPPWLI